MSIPLAPLHRSEARYRKDEAKLGMIARPRTFRLLVVFLVFGIAGLGSATEIPMIEKDGVFTVPVKMNGVLELQFIVDSGAAQVEIPADVVMTLTRTGTIAPKDFLSEPADQPADKSALPSRRFIIHRLQLGDYGIEEVVATVGAPQGLLILGQAALSRLPAWAIDNQRHVFLFADQSREPSQSPPPDAKPRSEKQEDAPAKSDKPKASNKDSSVDAPNVQPGYTYIIEALYPDDPKRNQTTERKVVSVDNGKITLASRNIKTGYVRTLEFTTEWNLISTSDPKGGGSSFQPPVKYFEFPLYPGKAWTQTSTETNKTTGTVKAVTLSATVGDWEDITVPAGSFRAIRITNKTETLDRKTGLKSVGEDVSWYSPQVGRSVKSLITSRDFSGNQERQVVQLLNFDLNEGDD